MSAISLSFKVGIIFSLATNVCGKSYSGSQIWRLQVDNDNRVQFVRYLHQRRDLSLWSGTRDTMDVLIENKKLDHVKSVLRRGGIKHQVLVDDVQEAIDKQKPTVKKATRTIDIGTKNETIDHIPDQNTNSNDVDNNTKHNKGAANDAADITDYNSYTTYNIGTTIEVNSNNSDTMDNNNDHGNNNNEKNTNSILDNTSGNNNASKISNDVTESCPTYSYGNERCSIHPDWTSFLNLTQIYDYMGNLAASCSRYCSIVEIGNSYLRKPIKVFKLSDGAEYNMAVWIDAGMHGMEWMGVSVVTYMMYHLATHFQYKTLRQHIDWYIAPVVNPDGYDYTFNPNGDRLWRKNLRDSNNQCMGVDLDRNFETGWGNDNSSDDPCDDFYRGPHAFSELETIAMQNFLLDEDIDFFVYISYHGYGQLILNPVSWTGEEMESPDNEDNHDLVKKMVKAIHNVSDIYYVSGEPSVNLVMNPSGVSIDWAYEVVNITYSYAICVRSSYTDLLPPSEILPTCKENVVILEVIADKMRSDMDKFGKIDYGTY